MLRTKAGLSSVSTISSSVSRGCSGKEAAEDLHALRAQVRKLRVRIFMVRGGYGGGRWFCSLCIVCVVRDVFLLNFLMMPRYPTNSRAATSRVQEGSLCSATVKLLFHSTVRLKFPFQTISNAGLLQGRESCRGWQALFWSKDARVHSASSCARTKAGNK